MKVNILNKNSQKCLKLIYRTHLFFIVFHSFMGSPCLFGLTCRADAVKCKREGLARKSSQLYALNQAADLFAVKICCLSADAADLLAGVGCELYVVVRTGVLSYATHKS